MELPVYKDIDPSPVMTQGVLGWDRGAQWWVLDSALGSREELPNSERGRLVTGQAERITRAKAQSAEA